MRRVLSSGPSAEDRLEQLLAQRRNELDEHAARLHESIAELERREELLRDSRASVERMLRLGTSELEARESELTSFVGELAEREAQLARSEEELARRRQELGAVELKRASVEGRERAVAPEKRSLQSSKRPWTSVRRRSLGRIRRQRRRGRARVRARRALPRRRDRRCRARTGNAFELEGDAFVVARVGRLSPPRGSAPLRLPRARAATQRVAGGSS